ncbi:hypothetical protein [Marinoscillum sp. MHG1-6]|nr:hypothetical protein [Marinoscillum sp. MHG1-6]
MMRLFILHIPMAIGTGFRVTVINDINCGLKALGFWRWLLAISD